jgi:hypothetical protein
VNNFTSHLVFMIHTAPGQGKVLCVDPSHQEVVMDGAYVVDEWNDTEQIREDFNANH